MIVQLPIIYPFTISLFIYNGFILLLFHLFVYDNPIWLELSIFLIFIFQNVFHNYRSQFVSCLFIYLRRKIFQIFFSKAWKKNVQDDVIANTKTFIITIYHIFQNWSPSLTHNPVWIVINVRITTSISETYPICFSFSGINGWPNSHAHRHTVHHHWEYRNGTRQNDWPISSSNRNRFNGDYHYRISDSSHRWRSVDLENLIKLSLAIPR